MKVSVVFPDVINGVYVLEADMSEKCGETQAAVEYYTTLPPFSTYQGFPLLVSSPDTIAPSPRSYVDRLIIFIHNTQTEVSI